MEGCKISVALFILAVAARLDFTAAQNAKTGLPLTKIGTGFYFFEKNTQRDWFNADLYCRSYGLALVSFETKEELTLVGAELIKQGMVNNGWVHTSGTDMASEGTFSWTQTGEKISYSAWASGEPNNYNNDENCLTAVNANGAWSWNDRNCKDRGQFLCELPTACWGY